MKLKTIIFILICCSITLSAQTPGKWQNWTWLIGQWKGEGSGQPGQGEGTFSFSLDLDSNILIRKSHSVYPGSAGRPETVHNDLMIVYPSDAGIASKAVYFDNEGHTIFYNIVVSPKSILFTSEKAPDLPVFRLTYTLLEEGMVNTRFEMSPDGQKFINYIEGKSKRIN